MSVYIAGFIAALILAALVVIWITYCMFIREHHKSEFYQYNISDLQQRAFQLSQEEEKAVEKKEITAGIFILPSRRKQKDDEYYNSSRPDYPESPIARVESTDKLVDIFDDNVDVHFRDGIIDVDSPAPYHSEV